MPRNPTPLAIYSCALARRSAKLAPSRFRGETKLPPPRICHVQAAARTDRIPSR